jgi:hypothetical protein
MGKRLLNVLMLIFILSFCSLGLAKNVETVTIYGKLTYCENKQFYCIARSWGDIMYFFPANSSVAKDVLSVCKVNEYFKMTCVADHWQTPRNFCIGDYGGLGGTSVNKVINIKKITKKDWLNDPQAP